MLVIVIITTAINNIVINTLRAGKATEQQNFMFKEESVCTGCTV